jgi:cation/acetate symporter
MNYETSPMAVGVFAFFVAIVLGISFYLGAKAKSASGYYAAHGQIPWFVNGVAFAGDYLSAASFLGICGMIAFYGFDGFLYSIGYLAGWIVALLVIAEPLKRLGKFTFADALDSQFNSRGIKLAAAISTLVVSVFYLIPQMVGAGALVKPLLGFEHYQGVMTVGVIVVLIVVTAGMVSTTWVQFIKGGLLVVFCAILTVMILNRGLTTKAVSTDLQSASAAQGSVVPATGDWATAKGEKFRQVEIAAGQIVVEQKSGDGWRRVQSLVKREGRPFVNGLPQGKLKGETDFYPVGHVVEIPDAKQQTGPLSPAGYLATLQDSKVEVWRNLKLKDAAGIETTVYYPQIATGEEIMTPGGSPTFSALRSDLYVEEGGQQVFSWKALWSKLDFLSLMLALFGGTASLPHILIRYYTVKDQASARKSTVVGIASIGFFYILTLFLGLGAMTSGQLDVTDSNMSAPLLARSFGELPFAVISAIAFTTVLGTVSGLIMAASGAVAHDILANFLKIEMNDHTKVRAGKVTAVAVGLIAIVLGILFGKLNVNFLVGWAFNIAASANLPALVMLLFWRGTTKQGITAAIFVGMLTSLAWILLSAQCYKDVYGLPPETAIVPFSQPGIVTIPLGFAVLVGVSLMTRTSQYGTSKS